MQTMTTELHHYIKKLPVQQAPNFAEIREEAEKSADCANAPLPFVLTEMGKSGLDIFQTDDTIKMLSSKA